MTTQYDKENERYLSQLFGFQKYTYI
jgi:hypothetical protein